MEKILAAPREQVRVFLHPDQRQLVEMRANGPVRVLGSPGTGKTTVAMHRATWLARNACAQGQKILFTTFTKNLAADIAASLKKLCSREEWERIEVVNLDAWARHFLEKQGFPLKLTSEDASRENFWEQALGLIEGDLNYPPEFIRGEWDDVIQAQGIEKCDGYVTAPRVGRARRLNREERKQLWPVFEGYRALITERGLSEPADSFRAATRLIADRTIAFPYHAALVDEAQDFGNEAFRLIRAIVPVGENDLFIVGDAHQRIYGHQVVLSRCGIDIRGRGRKLKLNFRTG
jgi:superfamily I DNA/RNA helicase